MKQSGAPLGDVVLPPWAKGDAREFIRAHREVCQLVTYSVCMIHHFIRELCLWMNDCILLSSDLSTSSQPTSPGLASYGLRGCTAPWFTCWFWHYINRLLAYLTYLLSSFLIYFITYLFPYLSASSSIGPFCFQAGGRRRWSNLALFFCIHFVL